MTQEIKDNICEECGRPLDEVYGLTEFGHDHAGARAFSRGLTIAIFLWGLLFMWGMSK